MNTQTLWIIVTGCIIATFFWRLLGAIVVQRMAERGELYEWVNCVSYALVAALVFRMIIIPQSDLAILSIWSRVSAVGLAFIIYFLFKRNLLAGVAAGSACFSIMVAFDI
ncbi:MAG: AzlD domain-containing protein [Gammaproteobacteria bacterium]|nr:AzlD domain-containing protein [Gammaproteobacteria bacterium]